MNFVINAIKLNNGGAHPTGTEIMVIKRFLCSTQLSTKFQLLIKQKYRQMKKFLALSLSDVVFIMLINVKSQQLLAF